jgi:hypothetical protein
MERFMRWNDPVARGLAGDDPRGNPWHAWQATAVWMVLAAIAQSALLRLFLE